MHRRTANLLIHIFAVPLFVFAHALFVVGIFSDKSLLPGRWYASLRGRTDA